MGVFTLVTALIILKGNAHELDTDGNRLVSMYERDNAVSYFDGVIGIENNRRSLYSGYKRKGKKRSDSSDSSKKYKKSKSDSSDKYYPKWRYVVNYYIYVYVC